MSERLEGASDDCLSCRVQHEVLGRSVAMLRMPSASCLSHPAQVCSERKATVARCHMHLRVDHTMMVPLPVPEVVVVDSDTWLSDSTHEGGTVQHQNLVLDPCIPARSIRTVLMLIPQVQVQVLRSWIADSNFVALQPHLVEAEKSSRAIADQLVRMRGECMGRDEVVG